MSIRVAPCRLRILASLAWLHGTAWCGKQVSWKDTPMCLLSLPTALLKPNTSGHQMCVTFGLGVVFPRQAFLVQTTKVCYVRTDNQNRPKEPTNNKLSFWPSLVLPGNNFLENLGGCGYLGFTFFYIFLL